MQLDLFGRHVRAAQMARLYERIDDTSKQHRGSPIFLASSLEARACQRRTRYHDPHVNLLQQRTIRIPMFASSIAEANS